MAIDHLLFDTTDFETMEDTHSVGAYVRSGRSGALITHHSPIEAGDVTFDFVDGDVTVGTDAIAETAHGLFTGDVVQLTTTGTLPTGLALATDYYVIRVDADSFKLAASAKDAEEGTAVDITAAAGGGTHTVTEQEVDRRALDVWVVNPVTATISGNVNVTQGTDPWIIGDGGNSITVDAVDLDIRDLTHVSDSIKIGDGTDFLEVNADGSINVVGGSEHAEDSAHTSGDTGNFMLAVRNDVEGTLVDTNGDYAPLQVDSSGRLRVISDLDYTDPSHYAEDSAHTTGDIGSHVLAVRQDTLAASTDADGDYASLKVNSLGALYVDGQDEALADTAIATASNDLGAADTAEDIVASPLASRKYLWIYNNDNRKMWIGATGVSAATGFPISPGSYLELRAGASIDVEWVSGTTGHNIRTMELS
jgi:hypothetical protein